MTSTKEGCDLLSPKDDTTQSSPPAASLDDDILVQYICHQKDAYFRHQQRDEEDLSLEEKQRIVGSLLHTNASVFLHRYGKFLDERFLQYIESQPEREHSDDINVQIAGLREKNRLRDSAVKNRRYNAMQKMLTEGVYFSNTEMQSRNPYLFEQMIGQYMDNQQRKELQEASYSANYENTNFSSYLMEQIRTTHMNCQYMVDEHVNDQEEEEEEDDDEEDVEKAENPGKPADISPEDKAQLEEEFRSQMMESFLMGKDSDFDYSRVDDNEDYDMSDQFERDQEDRYFDED